MKKNKLLIFVDALPFEKRGLFQDVVKSWDLKLSKLIPGYGFSSNQHNLLIRGLTPDQAGFFTDYSINEEENFGPYLNHDNWITYLYRRIQSKLGSNRANIPLGMGNLFKQSSIYPLSSKKMLDSVTQKFHNWDVLIDGDAFTHLKRGTCSKNTFLIFNHIDALGHYKGIDTIEYEIAVEKLFLELDKYIRNNAVEILLFSDHGMSRNPKSVKLSLEKYFGKQTGKGFRYFIDSTTLRVWCDDVKLLVRIKHYLGNIVEGSVISDIERNAYGLKSKNFGDIIFVLKNDYYFLPQYFGFGVKSKTCGMHGNIPSHPEQWGVWVGDGKGPRCDDARLFFPDVLDRFTQTT